MHLGIKYCTISDTGCANRVILPPLWLELALQVHQQFGTRFLVDVLNEFGFCSSNSEVQRHK